MSTFSKKLQPIPEDLKFWSKCRLETYARKNGAKLNKNKSYYKKELKNIIWNLHGLPPLITKWTHSNRGELIDICNKANIKYYIHDTRDTLINLIRLKYGEKQRFQERKTKKNSPQSIKSEISKPDNHSDNISVISDEQNYDDNISLTSSEVTESKSQPKKSRLRIRKDSRKDYSNKINDLICRDGHCCQGCPNFCTYDSLPVFLRKKEAIFKKHNPRGNFELYKYKLIDIWKNGLQFDHIHEKADNGPEILENIQLLCYACHKVKTSHYNSNKILSFEERRDLDDDYRYMTRSVAEKQRDLEQRVKT